MNRTVRKHRAAGRARVLSFGPLVTESTTATGETAVSWYFGGEHRA